MNITELLKKRKIIDDKGNFNKNIDEINENSKQPIEYTERLPITKYNGGIQSSNPNARHISTNEINRNTFNNIRDFSRQARYNPYGAYKSIPKEIRSSIWDRVQNTANYLTYSAGTGGVTGVTGLAQAGLTSVANETNKGANSSNGEIAKKMISGISPGLGLWTNIGNYAKREKEIITDKNRSGWNKIADTTTLGAEAGKHFIPGYDAVTGIMQIVGKNDNEASSKLLDANEKISTPAKKMQQKREEMAKNNDAVTNFVGDAMYSVGNMAPSIVATAVTKNPTIGLATMGESVKGQATQEALEKGKDLNTAVNIGDVKRFIEVATEKLSGGTKIFGKGSMDDIAEDFIKNKSKSTFGKFLAKQGYNIAGEITEEEISNIANNILDKGTTDPDKKIWDWKEALRTAGSTALTTGILNTTTGGMVGDYKNAKYETQREQNAQNWVNKAQDIVNQQTNQQQNQNALETNVTRGNKQLNLENNQNTLYNNSNEMESDINVRRGNETEDARNIQEGRQWDSNRGRSERGITTELDSTTEKLTNYKEKLNIINNSKNNIQKVNASQNMIDVYKDLGINLYGYNENQTNHDGLTYEGEVFINNASNVSREVVGAHELIHALRQNNNETYNNEIQPIINDVANNDEYRYTLVEYLKDNELSEGYLSDKYRNLLAEEVVGNVSSEILAKYEKNHYIGEENRIKLENTLMKITQGRKFVNDNQIKNSNESSFKLPTKQRTNLPSKGEQVNYTEMEKPEGKIRKHYRSIIKSSNTTPEAKAIAKELMGADTYVPESNMKQLNEADRRISQNGADNELKVLTSLSDRIDSKITANDIAVGERLIEYYSKIGDKAKLQEAIQSTAMAGTQAGQTVQALSLLNHQTPQGQVTWIQRSVDKMNKELVNRRGENTEQFNFTPEMQQKIMETTNPKEMNQVLNEIYEELGQQVSKSRIEQLDSWRYFSMLANPRTHIRNIVGNLAMGKTQSIKNKVAGAIEGTVSQFNPDMERTHTLKSASKEVKQFAKNDIVNVADRLELNQDKYNPKSRLEESMRTFKSDTMENTLGRLFDLNGKALEAEDAWGLKSGYVKALSEYMTANNLNPDTITDAQLAKARNYAIGEAKEATFHSQNAIATAINQFSRKNKFTKGMTDAVLPFVKTPMNVAKAGMEYNPAGLIKTLTVDTANLRKGNITVNKYIDNLSKGLTGTGIAVLGYAMAEAGILKASGGDDDKKEKYDEALGRQAYSIQIGDTTYSLDWLAPAGIPLFVGAEAHNINKVGKNEKNSISNDDDKKSKQIIDSLENWANAMSNSMSPMSEMSMISGLTSALKSYDQDSTKMLGQIGTNAVKSYVNQYVPTALGQIAKTTDKYERSTTSTKTGVLSKAIDQTKLQIMSKVPGLRQKLPIRTDIWGNEQKQEGNILPIVNNKQSKEGNFITKNLRNGVVPFTIKNVNNSVVDKELNDLYSKTGESSILPTTSLDKTYTIDGQKYRMTNDEYNKYKNNYGKNSYKLIENLVKSKDYKNLTDEQKQKAIENIYSYAKEVNKIDYAKNNNLKIKPSTLYNTMKALVSIKGGQSAYLDYTAKTKDIESDIDKAGVLFKSNYSENTKKAIYSNTIGKMTDEIKEKNKKNNILDETYYSYKYEIGKLKNEKIVNNELDKKDDLNDKDKIQVLLDSSLSKKDRQAIYENYIKTQPKDGDVDIYKALKENGVDINQYLKYKQQGFESDKEDNGTLKGKSVSGSKKTKIYDYVNKNISGYTNKLLIIGSQYKLSLNERQKIYETINSLPNTTKDERMKLLNKMKGFTVYKDGSVKF